jgi:CspA family cold shock protein
VRATVDKWFDDEGWGVLDAPEFPGWIFVHFSFIDGEGYKALEPGEAVEMEDVEDYGHDGCRWMARRVRRLG